jgi:hypothetical protein
VNNNVSLKAGGLATTELKEALMAYKKGERVKHPAQEDWGLGEVLEDSSAKKVRVFFVEAGHKTLSLKHVELITVEGDQANHPLLDNLAEVSSSGEIEYKSLSQSVEGFLRMFPKGFYKQRFITGERKYKEKAHSLALELLSAETFLDLLRKAEHDEISKRALKVVNATNLIFPNEKMALKDGLQTTEGRKEFSARLYDLLYGKSELKERFMAFSKMLQDIEAAKWTTATYFLFIFYPDRYMFLKPTNTKNAASLSAFQINYRSDLNWLTYKSVLDFSEYLKSQLWQLKPRDMIDVQSFMWYITPGQMVKTGPTGKGSGLLMTA